jgi:aminocarboxymuconate-semialdehyde decarboxylase
MKRIDFHSHVIPESIIAAMCDDPDLYATRIEEQAGKRFFVRGKVRLELTPEFWSAEGKLESMDRKKIDVSVISPGPQIFFHSLAPADGARAVRLVNEGIAKMVAEQPGRLRGMAGLPMQDADAAVAEMERVARDFGFKAVEIATAVPSGEIADAKFRPLLRRAQELNMTVFAHPNTVGAVAARLDCYYLGNIIGNPLETAIMAAKLMYSGALDELPQLKMLLAHGGGFLPYQIGRLAHGHAARPETRADSGMSPRALLGRFYFDTITHEPQALRFLIDLVGSARIVLGSDSPFDMGDAGPAETLEEVPRLSDPERADICHRTALRLLGE